MKWKIQIYFARYPGRKMCWKEPFSSFVAGNRGNGENLGFVWSKFKDLHENLFSFCY